ncbi:MAG: GNAT family N-acetyltransferase [Actinomycetota bacterium]|nr:GNAT family N-acetyltransferase [Actinomycetota bacterium]
MMVRAAVAEDADEVRRLSEQFTPSARQERSLELFTDEYARIIDDNRYLLAVADSPSGRLAGYLLAQDYGPGLRHSFTVGRIRDLFVDGRFRRRGIARDLVAAAATWAAERPLPMILDWQAGPGSTDFYRALGYEPDCRTTRVILASTRSSP